MTNDELRAMVSEMRSFALAHPTLAGRNKQLALYDAVDGLLDSFDRNLVWGSATADAAPAAEWTVYTQKGPQNVKENET